MQLSLNKATTKELIETYFLEKLNEQVIGQLVLCLFISYTPIIS